MDPINHEAGQEQMGLGLRGGGLSTHSGAVSSWVLLPGQPFLLPQLTPSRPGSLASCPWVVQTTSTTAHPSQVQWGYTMGLFSTAWQHQVMRLRRSANRARNYKKTSWKIWIIIEVTHETEVLNTLWCYHRKILPVRVSATHRNKGSKGAWMLQRSNLQCVGVILETKTYEITLLQHSHPLMKPDPISNSKATQYL